MWNGILPPLAAQHLGLHPTRPPAARETNQKGRRAHLGFRTGPAQWDPPLPVCKKVHKGAMAAQASKWDLTLCGDGSSRVGVRARARATAGGRAAEGDRNRSTSGKTNTAARGAGQIPKDPGSPSLGGEARAALGHPGGTHRTSSHALNPVRSRHRAPGPRKGHRYSWSPGSSESSSDSPRTLPGSRGSCHGPEPAAQPAGTTGAP